jgi:acetolactate synthase-1/2/3 large subunit
MPLDAERTANLTHADVMARTLADRGVQTVFGLPGGEILAFVDACRRSGLRFLLTGHEASAAWMAQVMGQLTGTPGVCAATLGPGATNFVTAVANAWLDRAPVLAVTAQISKSAIDTMTHQRVPLESLFAPITKASATIGERDTDTAIAEALDLASTPRPGPVHLSLASDTAIQEAACGRSSTPGGFAARPSDQHALTALSARIRSAARPLILVGLGATPDCAPAIRALIQKLQCPFLVTPKVKGIAPEDDPMFLGVASGMAIDSDVVATIREADLVIAIGFDPVECDKTWFTSIDVVSIDSVTMAEGEYKPNEVLGDIASLVIQLTAAIDSPKPWPPELLAARRRVLHPELAPLDKGVSPLRLIETLREVFPRDGIAACDVGSHKLAMGQFWRSFEPGTFLMSNGLSGMGFGLPAAIAAQLVYPEKRVLAAVGDGGMLMMLHDLTLIRALNLPILIVVFCDRSLSLIRLSGERRGFPPYGVDFDPPDFPAIAGAFGIEAGRATTLEAVRDAAEQALSRRVPFLLEVPVDHREYRDLIR